MAPVATRFAQLCGTYLSSIRGISATTRNRTEQDAAVRNLLIGCEELWAAALDAQLFSRNEGLEEHSTTALEVLWLPFIISDLYQQFQGDVEEIGSDRGRKIQLSDRARGNDAEEGGPSTTAPTTDPRMERESTHATNSSSTLNTEQSVRLSVRREASLSRSKAWCRLFLERMEDVGLFTEKERERFLPAPKEEEEGGGPPRGGAAGPSRERRIELSRLRREMEGKWRELENKVAYLKAKQERLRGLEGGRRRHRAAHQQNRYDDEDDEEDTGAGSHASRLQMDERFAERKKKQNGDDTNTSEVSDRQERHKEAEMEMEAPEDMEEDSELTELRRERALARLRFGCYESCYQQDLNQREMDMLTMLNPQARATISKLYQETLDAVRRGEKDLGRQTYTILPNGTMIAGTPDKPLALDPEAVEKGGGGTALAALAGSSGSLMGPSGAVLAQQVRDQLMVDRNPPTQTLKEFAEGEIAQAMAQQQADLERQREQQAEDERLGPEGVEERERIKSSKWDDWKDDNPVYGKTSKGNYS